MIHGGKADTHPIVTAIFVDFDNIFSSLRNVNADAAEKFARDPTRWLNWFRLGDHAISNGEHEGAHPRRIVVRRCYLNPAAYGNQRAAFVRSGFSVIDCPSLTAQGKSSADIYMVMDIMDSLKHQTQFEEFIILSSDADFTPILLRLREHMRRTTIIANAVAAAALRAACDFVVPLDAFIEDALGMTEPIVAVPGLGEQPGTLLSNEKPSSARPNRPDAHRTIADVKRMIEDLVRISDTPILQSKLGITLKREMGQTIDETKWFGYRTMTHLLKFLAPISDFKYINDNEKIFVYDPIRHNLNSRQSVSLSFLDLAVNTNEFIEKMNKSIGLPILHPFEYSMVCGLIAHERQSGASGNLLIADRVRDASYANGRPVGRSSINFILTGIESTDPNTGHRDLALAFRDYAASLARHAQLALSEQELAMLDQWLVAGIPPETDAAEDTDNGHGPSPAPEDTSP